MRRRLRKSRNSCQNEAKLAFFSSFPLAPPVYLASFPLLSHYDHVASCYHLPSYTCNFTCNSGSCVLKSSKNQNRSTHDQFLPASVTSFSSFYIVLLVWLEYGRRRRVAVKFWRRCGKKYEEKFYFYALAALKSQKKPDRRHDQ